VLQAIFPDAMADGFRRFTGRYGLAVSHIEVRYVNGHPYASVRIAGVPPSDRPPPPGWLLRVLTRVHPELRRRDRQARVALRDRVWVEDLRRWEAEERPRRLASLRALQAVDPEGLDDAALAAHVERSAAELADGLREHFALVGASSIPVGLHILREQGRGRSAAEAVADLAGSAAATTAAAVPALRAVAAALAAAGAEPTTLDEVRRASPEASVALDVYLSDYGHRVVGANDVTGRRLLELPDVVLRSIAAAGQQAWSPPPAATGDPVIDDARAAVACRDDHAGVCGAWPVGLLRRALLEAGQRLEHHGRLQAADHVMDATAGEVAGLLRHDPAAPSAAELADRAADRTLAQAVSPPPVLGDDHPPPDPVAFPAGLRRMAEALGAFLEVLGARRDQRGVGIGQARHRGRAVVADDADEAIARLQPGDVLVTSMTTPSFGCVLPIAGALVTAHGGAMSHAGIVARELGIPAVLGVADALERIADGDEVEVDPVAGTVRRVVPGQLT
jgi:pyruvate,water dikinase